MSKKNFLPFIILLIILGIGAFLRLYRIGDYMTFLGDEGRDALVVKRMIVDREFTLLGPITSVGLMHLGPIYYYFMALFLLLSGLDPVGPAVMVALFSLATVILIWKLCREFFDTKAAVVASLGYALSPLVIIHSHSSWNPNILPFWALLIIYSLLKAIVKEKYKWLVVTGISLGVVLQLHYIAFVFIPIIFTALFLLRMKASIRHYLLGIVATVFTFSPFILFEIRHQFINTLTVWQFATRGGDAKTFGVATFFERFWDLAVRFFWRLVVIKNAEYSIILLLVVAAILVYLFKTLPQVDIKRKTLTVFLVWFGVGVGLLSFYTGNIYDYYLMFAFPLPFILLGVVMSVISRNLWGKIVGIFLIVALSYFQLETTPISRPPNRLAFQAKQIADFISEKAGNEKYNFALIAAGNSDHAYRYFLEIAGNSPVVIKNPDEDPTRTSVTQQLFVVCEEKICQPLGHPLWEIAGFGRAEIVGEWPVGLFKVFKLLRYTGQV